MKRIHVAAGVIRNAEGRILVGQRTVRDQYYQKWEFPGGKLEPGETAEQALRRELHEELSIDVNQSEPLITIRHDYPDRKVALFVREVFSYIGDASGAEGQAIQWVKPEDLGNIDFLQANESIIRAVQLPVYMLITQTDRFGVDIILDKIDHLIKQKKTFLVQVREHEMSMDNLQKFVTNIKKRTTGKNIRLIVNGSIETAIKLQADGVHLKANLLNKLHADELVQLPKDFLIGASCHNEHEVKLANQFVDYAVLGSVMPTSSHPDDLTLGWQDFEKLTDIARVPVYAVGGMAWQDKKRARECGGQGVAMISGAWE